MSHTITGIWPGSDNPVFFKTHGDPSQTAQATQSQMKLFRAQIGLVPLCTRKTIRVQMMSIVSNAVQS
jgi:hypothetical protein